MKRYTAGPWKAQIHDEQLEVVTPTGYTISIDTIAEMGHEACAVAALIKAAPELRDIVEELLRSPPDDLFLRRAGRVLNSVIAERDRLHALSCGKPDED